MIERDNLKSAAESIRVVLHNIPIEFAISDTMPLDHLIRALSIIEAVDHAHGERSAQQKTEE